MSQVGIHRDHVHVIQQQQRLLEESRPLSRTTRFGLPVRPAGVHFGARPYCSSSARKQRRPSSKYRPVDSPMRCVRTAATIERVLFYGRPVRLSRRRAPAMTRIGSSLTFPPVRWTDGDQFGCAIRFDECARSRTKSGGARDCHRVPSRREPFEDSRAANTPPT